MDYLTEKGHYVIKTVRSNNKGVADLIICSLHDGKFYAIEVKDKGKKNTETKLQKYHRQLVNNTGGKAIVADCLEDVKGIGL